MNMSSLNTNISVDKEIIEHFINSWPLNEWYNGYFHIEEISNINIHWLTFNPPNPINYTILASLYFFIMIFGLCGNLLVIFMYFRNRSLRNPANTLVVNLAISDCLMMSKMPIFIYNCLHRGPALGNFACKIYGFIGGLSGTVSIITLTTISLDRHIVIKYPLNRSSSKIRIKLFLICSWLYGLIFSSIPMLNIGLGKYQYEGYLISCSFDYLTTNDMTRNFIIIFFIAAYLLPLFIISFSYMQIVQVVLGRSWNLSDRNESVKHMKEKDQRKQEIKLALIVFIIICLWFFSWTPYAIISLLGVFNQKNLLTPIWSMIPALFCKSASAIDPYVYALSHPKYRAELNKLLNTFKRNNRIMKIWSTDTSKVPVRINLNEQLIREIDDGVEEELIDVPECYSTVRINNEVIFNDEPLKLVNNSKVRFITMIDNDEYIISRF